MAGISALVHVQMRLFRSAVMAMLNYRRASFSFSTG